MNADASKDAQDMRAESFFASEGERLDHGDGSVRENITRLVASGRELIGAELEWAKLKAALVATGVRNLLVFGILAVLFLLAALAILLFGAILMLAPLVGAALATLIVGAATLLVALLFGLAARRAVLLIKPGSKAP